MPRRVIAVLVAVSALTFAGVPARGDDGRDELKGDLLRAAKSDDEARVLQALGKAAKMVGSGKTFEDLGALADWIGAMPDILTGRMSVEVRLGWMYVMAKRGPDAIVPLEKALKTAPHDVMARVYLSEARLLVGDPPAAAKDLARAIGEGGKDEYVLPTIQRLLYEVLKDPKPAEGDALPEYATVLETLLAAKELPDVRRELVTRLAFDAADVKGNDKRAALFKTAAVRQAWTYLRTAATGADSSRLAYDAAGWWTALGTSRPADLPDRFDLLATAVRLGDKPQAETHEVPEALAAMAEAALAKGRYVLADKMARRRLSISDSPAARRVLLALPPDVGD